MNGAPRRRLFSLWEPWAILCCAPHPVDGSYAKPYETRHWQTRAPLPMRVAIHAAKHWNRECAVYAWNNCRAALVERDYQPWRAGKGRPSVHRPLPFGAIIATATIVAVIPVEEVPPLQRRFGDFTPGRYAFEFAERCQLPEPIPYKATQTPLLTLPAEIDDEITRIVAGMRPT